MLILDSLRHSLGLCFTVYLVLLYFGGKFMKEEEYVSDLTASLLVFVSVSQHIGAQWLERYHGTPEAPRLSP